MVFFDIGGVMYDDTVYARSWMKALRESGAEFTDEEFEREYTPTRAAQSGSFRRRLTERSWARMRTWRRSRRAPPSTGPTRPPAIYPDVVPCLEALHGPLPAGDHRQPADLGARRDGPRRVSAPTSRSGASATTSGLQKPDPKLFSQVLYTAGVAPTRAVMLGDRLDYDVRPAKTAGMRTIWVLRGEAPDEPTARAAGRARCVGADARRDPRHAGVMGSRKRVLIVGGGFAGMYAALHMKPLAKAGHDVTLVSSDNFMQYQPFLPEVASGTIDPRAAVVPLAAAVAARLGDRR